MSDTPATVSDGGQLTGERATEHRAGYREIVPRENSRPERGYDSNDRTAARQAADELIGKRKKSVEVPPVRYADKDGRTLPDNVSVPLKRAVEDRAEHLRIAETAMELTDRDQIARQVDDMRKEAGVPTDPAAPVDPDQINPHLFGDLPYQAPQLDPAHLRPTPPAPPGIDPEVHRAMQHPQVRQAMEEEFGKAAKLQQQHAQQVQVANDFALSALRTAIPELANLRPDQVAPFLNQLARTNPQRYKQAVALCDNVKNADTARKQVEAQRAQIERQNFARESAAQDQAFDRAVSHYTPEQRRAVTTEMVDYAQSLGIDRRTLTHLMATNPIMRHAAFQKMMFDAAAGSLARKQLAAHQRQNKAALPPVVRPGTSNGGGARAVQSTTLNALRNKLDATGDAKDAAALLVASRNARRR